ncbi:MAG: D-alanine--D-alanine ligase [Planctomycetota bacterium]
MAPLRVLHVVGSPTSEFYARLSASYAADVVRPAGVDASFAEVRPDGRWAIGDGVGRTGPAQRLEGVTDALRAHDVVVSHLFCHRGMTAYRALLEDVLGVPLVGPAAGAAELATDKALTRAVAAAHGVRVAGADVLRAGERPTRALPVVVKPCCEDNSRGVHLVREPAELEPALRDAFRYGDRVLVEDFVPGCEVRAAVLERGGRLHVPSMIEYALPPERPIRGLDAKLELGAEGLPRGQSRTADHRCPAPLDAPLRARIEAAARRAHGALRSRGFSLFDFRIDARSGEPVLIEACPFWSFSPRSMISRMLAADGECIEAAALEQWRAAAARRARGDEHGREAAPDPSPTQSRGHVAATPVQETTP